MRDGDARVLIRDGIKVGYVFLLPFALGKVRRETGRTWRTGRMDISGIGVMVGLGQARSFRQTIPRETESTL